MQNHLTISKLPPVENSMNFEFLRQQGLEHIEKLGSKLWTDYNVHDPGITLLEALCYAITDLGHRTAFPIKDLLAEPPGAPASPQFFTAGEILTCNPVTENDLRKVIIDTTGVKNAWIALAEQTEPELYVDCEQSRIRESGGDEKRLWLRGLYKILLELDDDVDIGDGESVEMVKAAVAEKLHAVRSLCEDIVSVDIIGNELIGVCADIELEPDAMPEEVLAEIYLQLHGFISPSLKFYSLQELLDKGKRSEEIFDGPLLEHGFIDSDDLKRTLLPQELHASDVYGLIMKVSGVKAVKKLFLNSHDSDGAPLEAGEWCIPLHPPSLKARFSPEHSGISFYKSIIPISVDQGAAREKFEIKRNVGKKNYAADSLRDFSIPTGTYHNLEEYTSIQAELPRVYGVGESGLPDSASDSRKAQAKQLQGYLAFFDQLLANYLSQLAHVKDLLSVFNTDDRTNFVSALHDVPGIKGLLADFNGYSGGWDDFVADSANDYLQKLSAMAESPNIQNDRRNRFLDHLMARFGERFNDYALLMYDIFGNRANPELIGDKESFLQNYSKISYNRGRAFNYRAWDHEAEAPMMWDSPNVSGLEARLAGLLGIENHSRRDLTCPPKYTLQVFRVSSGPDSGKYRFRLRDEDSAILLNSVMAYEARPEAVESAANLEAQLLLKKNYVICPAMDGGYRLHIIMKSGESLAQSRQRFDSEPEAGALKQKIIELTCPQSDCDKEGFHLVEHLLLRPRGSGYAKLPIKTNCTSCSEAADPYSFRISLVLPCWPPRFAQWTFRTYIEETIRRETPAHIAVKVCWVDCMQMKRFQNAYLPWLELGARPVPKDAGARAAWMVEYRDATNALIDSLFSLRNVHKTAKLHDCKSTEDTLVLGHGNLGEI